jgi:hypothetical protein
MRLRNVGLTASHEPEQVSTWPIPVWPDPGQSAGKLADDLVQKANRIGISRMVDRGGVRRQNCQAQGQLLTHGAGTHMNTRGNPDDESIRLELQEAFM